MIEIIAEIGINHNGDILQARRLIKEAYDAGADVAKFQAYDVDKLFPDKKVMAQGRNWYKEVKKTQLTKHELEHLAIYCRNLGIEFFCSAFDIERLGWLEEIGVKRHKVATPVNENRELIDAMFDTNKEILVSCKRRDLSYAYWHPQDKLNRVKWLYCIPLYPTPLNKLEFEQIGFPNEFQGLSEHTIGVEASMIAMARGAKIIEKHFTLDKNDQNGPDHICSATPDEMRQIVNFARKVEEVGI